MLFFQKKYDNVELTIDEFFRLNTHLDNVIAQWIKREAPGAIQKNTKINEIALFNMKLIYTNSTPQKEFVEFIQQLDDGNGEVDYIFSRLQDLYITIQMSFPRYFIESIHDKHVKSLEAIGFDVVDEVVESFPYGWLLAKIQSMIRSASPRQVV